jgi:hypothetical protein
MSKLGSGEAPRVEASRSYYFLKVGGVRCLWPGEGSCDDVDSRKIEYNIQLSQRAASYPVQFPQRGSVSSGCYLFAT